MRVPRWLKVFVAVLASVALAFSVWQFWIQTPTSAAPGQDGWVSTKYGPLGAADRDLLIKVRLAGLWEHPTGQEAESRATQPRVREIAGFISTEHHDLDLLVVDVARELGVQLPSQPTEQQQEWMREITASSGADYDRNFVQFLRLAHGNVYPAIASVRASTRNEKVREFATEAETYVSRHMGYLESTGLVQFDELPETPAPPRAVVTPAGRYEDVPIFVGSTVIIALLILVAVLIGPMIANRRRRVVRHTSKGVTNEARTSPLPIPPGDRSHTVDNGNSGRVRHRRSNPPR